MIDVATLYKGSVLAFESVPSIGPVGGAYRVYMSPDGSVIVSQISGFWSIEDASAYFRQMNQLIATFRNSGKPIRMLTDRREALVQQPSVNARFGAAGREFAPRDRLAVLVASRLIKLQLARETHNPAIKVVTSLAEAVAWLQNVVVPKCLTGPCGFFAMNLVGD